MRSVSIPKPYWLDVMFWLWLITLTGLASACLILPQVGRLFVYSPPHQLLSAQAVPWVFYTLCFAQLLVLMGQRGIRMGMSLLAFLVPIMGGIVFSSIWETWQILEVGHNGLSTLYEVSLCLWFLLGLFGLWLAQRQPVVLYAALPLLLLQGAGLLYLISIGQHIPKELIPALQNSILPLHVGLNFVAYAAFFLSAGISSLVLWQERAQASWLPASAQLDTLAARLIHLGFPAFTTALALGCVWAYQAWGGYWSWDPKETWALIVWLVYAGYLHARLSFGWSLSQLAWFNLVGFTATLFCYLGVNFLLGGLHSYGSVAP